MILQVITPSFFIWVLMKIVKLTVTLKKRKSDQSEKETMTLNILRLETKLLKILKKLKLLS